ncbi:MAG: helix-turn-helix transcriptional regulator [Anaerolineae bacterium]|nr:helix-turn-helix transcriptional regulator [Anaerolineae bacterium]
MSFLERLRHSLGFASPPPPASIEISPALLPHLERFAAQEGQPLDAVINGLLHHALAERLVALAHLQRWEALTPREQQTAALACLGYTNQEIAAHMVISPNTVRTHMRHILHKFEANSKTELREMLAGWDFSAWVSGSER